MAGLDPAIHVQAHCSAPITTPFVLHFEHTRIGVGAMAETRHMLPDWARSALSLAFLFIVAFATAGNRLPLFIAIMVSAALAIAAIQLLFPVGRLFSIAFAYLIAVYAAIFSACPSSWNIPASIAAVVHQKSNESVMCR
jgi:hypothetical protein